MLGLLAGIGALAIPGIGPFIAAGPIVTTLAGIGSGGVVGGILLSVHSDNSDWTGKAKDIFRETGGEDIASAGEHGADYAKSDRPLSRGAGIVS